MRFRPAWLVLTATFSAVTLLSAPQTKKPVTVKDLVDHRSSGARISPVWSPNGDAFLYPDQGKIYRYDVAARKANLWFETAPLEKLAKTPEASKAFGWQNRRVSADSFQWFPNGKDVLAAISGDLFVLHPDGKHQQITATASDEADPKLSPDGQQVVYRTNSNLYAIELATKKVRQLTLDGSPTLLNGQLDWVYPEELDLGTAVWWSPDSKQIAYLQFDVSREFVYPQVDLTQERAVSEPERYPQAGTSNAEVKLGVLSLIDPKTRWMKVGETSNTLLARVEWLPDSRQVALERLSRVQDQLDLMFCDPKTGSVRNVIHEHSKTWINMTDNLYFLKSKPEFLWTSERSGFRHLYRYSLKGDLVAELTSGDWEVSAVKAIDESNQKVYYTSSEVSPLETQFYTVPLGGGARTRLSQEAGTHGISSSPDGKAYLDTFSSSIHPPEVTLHGPGGEQIAIVKAADHKTSEEYDLLPSEIVQVPASDGTILYGRVTKPAGFQPGVKYPAIVSVYGGPGVHSIRNAWSGLSMEQVFAHRGYVVWMLDNRGSAGRGHAFEEPVYRKLGQQEVADQRLGVEHLIELGYVDAGKIGVTGWSYGGYMTLRCLLLAPDLFKVGVAGAPVTDWHNYDTIYTERYMGLPGENKKGYQEGSNIQAAEKLQGKLLLIHNFEDDNVLLQNTMQMANALEKADKQFYMQLYPQKTHGVTGPISKTMYEGMLDFFDKNLKNGQ